MVSGWVPARGSGFEAVTWECRLTAWSAPQIENEPLARMIIISPKRIEEPGIGRMQGPMTCPPSIDSGRVVVRKGMVLRFLVGRQYLYLRSPTGVTMANARARFKQGLALFIATGTRRMTMEDWIDVDTVQISILVALFLLLVSRARRHP